MSLRANDAWATRVILLGFLLLGLQGLPGVLNQGFCAETVQSYIDQQKKLLEKNAQESGDSLNLNHESYTERMKKRLNAQEAQDAKTSQGSQNYIERLKSAFPEKFQTKENLLNHPGESYTEKKKLELEPKESTGAIQAVNEGRSQLELKRPGSIHHAFGLRYGASLTRALTADAGIKRRDFNDVYGANYAPDLSLFYEFQPFHSEWFGSLGFVLMGGVSYFNGKGVFGSVVTKPEGGTFGSSSKTKFQFFAIPLTAGLSYRFNLLRLLRPYVIVGPTLYGYGEKRDDGIAGSKGTSYALTTIGGVAFLLDWLSSQNSSDLYANYQVKHFYLTVDYTQVTPISGDVGFSISGIVAGLSFEY